MSINDQYNEQKYLQYKIYFIVAPNSGSILLEEVGEAVNEM